MKNYFIILGLFLFLVNTCLAYQKTYLQQTTTTPNVYSPVYRPVYNPYAVQYYNPYQYRKINANNAKKLRRLQLIRRMQRQNLYNNFLTWNKGKGKLTGYSTPISKDIYDQMGISPYDPKSKQSTKSPTCNTDLFSSPMGDEMYYKNGEKRTNLGGTSGKTGVTIIYD